MTTSTATSTLSRALSVWVLALLLCALVVGIGPNLDGRLVGVAEQVWPGYAAHLRQAPTAPDCDLVALQARTKTCSTAAPTATTAPADPFAEPAAVADPFADTATAAADNCTAVQQLVSACQAAQQTYRDDVAARTGSVAAFSALEGAVGAFSRFAWLKHLLVVLVVSAGFVASLGRRHIALRDPVDRVGAALGEAVQLVAHLLWLSSCVADVGVLSQSDAPVDDVVLSVLWCAGFVVLAGTNVVHLVRPPNELPAAPWSRARVFAGLSSVPLYAVMASVAGVYFLVVEHHSSGAAIFLHKFAQIPSVYVGIGLYMWTGLLLARTRVASLVFAVVTPLRLPPAALAVVVVVLSAWPVAWSGASGIFVVAVGSVVFRELRAAGASRSLATAVTAMAGSLGVVLRPCLVVVLVATLNTDVTTDDLYNRGRLVFALTSVLTAVAFFVWHRVWPPATSASSSAAAGWSGSLAAVRALLVYGVLAAVVLGACWLLLGADLNEHTAPLILPMVVLAWIALEVRRDVDGPSMLTRLQTATADTSGTLGALLLMMCGSVALGGVVERAEVMRVLPSSFASPVAAMAVVIVLLVLIGMFMDELGAVVLVSVTLAPIARASGIDPVHFWLVVLVGFELGYLAPPVALNQLLARQIIATIDADNSDDDTHASWWQRQAHVLVPAAVMATALVVVAFAPFVWALL